MNVLAIDTSNHSLGVAIIKNSHVAGELVTTIKKNHSVRLMPAIQQLMASTETTPEELDRIAVAVGPGSFTGVRIGLSTAKTMAWSLDIPVVGISSLEAVAFQGQYFSGQVCPFFDARRGLVYTSLYDGSGNRIKDEANVLMNDWLLELKATETRTLFLSQDLQVHEEQITSIMGDLAVIPEASYHQPRPASMGLAAIRREPTPVHRLVPNYLRMAEAEAKWLERQEKS
ncbi:tRNA (adenosine(37)-N6)-threonylcarbamoyltransferase complex dimerization subunit type 1 TsaB [Thalassobacillus sp. CUG 92003]|uniref:tRNA (adenosine(37)-N6)-threonylcarbamoyltransferase complex dimerization subunit type 1 TsaB n=1 Tax=Thalassobacillus sp. CUG 92003 TaxID=2736641 RepID=UPI0015E7CA00|nr:tRNA (adenosine(37)-N6)-threonylcarbamoyltransferase complex dimerization subunit type 1 TsaB [Thalassobacillus sp. CUG 92003]